MYTLTFHGRYYMLPFIFDPVFGTCVNFHSSPYLITQINPTEPSTTKAFLFGQPITSGCVPTLLPMVCCSFPCSYRTKGKIH